MTRTVIPKNAIVVEIDEATYYDGMEGLFHQLSDMETIWGYKLNADLGLMGIDRVITDIKRAHPRAKLMFDLKFDGTCDEVEALMIRMKRERIDFVTLHGTSGRFPIEAAISAGPQPQVLLSAVSNLSTREDCREVHGASSPIEFAKRTRRRAIELCTDGVVLSAQDFESLGPTPETRRPFMVMVQGVIPACTGVLPKDGLNPRLVRPEYIIRAGATHVVINALLLRTKDGAPRRQAIIEGTVREITRGLSNP